jgi:Tfp pilus assembly PilM family ATPase
VFTDRIRSILPARRGHARASVFVGVDLGERRTKLVGVARGDEGVCVTHAADEPTPAGLFRDRRIADPAAAGAFLAGLVRERGLTGASAALAVPAGDARVQRQQLPRMDDAALRNAVEADPALRLGGMETVAARYAFAELEPDARRGDPALMSLLTVSAREETIRALQTAAELAGLAPGPVTVAPVALANAWTAAFPERVMAGSRSVLLHGGFGGMLIAVLDGGVPVTAYEANLGVDYLAERSGRGGEGLLFKPGGMDELVLEEWVRRVVGDARRAAGAMSAGSGVLGDADGSGAVWISGGVARLPGIAERFRVALGVPVHLFDPLAPFPATVDAPLPFAPALAVAAGLALENLTLAPVHP